MAGDISTYVANNPELLMRLGAVAAPAVGLPGLSVPLSLAATGTELYQQSGRAKQYEDAAIKALRIKAIQEGQGSDSGDEQIKPPVLSQEEKEILRRGEPRSVGAILSSGAAEASQYAQQARALRERQRSQIPQLPSLPSLGSSIPLSNRPTYTFIPRTPTGQIVPGQFSRPNSIEAISKALSVRYPQFVSTNPPSLLDILGI